MDRLIEHWNGVAELARGLQLDEVGSLRVGAIESCMESAIAGSVRRFQQRKPRVACQIVTGNTDQLAHSLLGDELDFAVCGEPPESSGFYFEPLYREHTILVADHNHPLARRDSVNFEEILGYPVTAGGRTCLYHMQFAKHLARYKESPLLLNTVNRISSIPYFIRGTLAVGVVLESTPLIPEVARLNVRLDLPRIPVGFLQARKQIFAAESSARLLQRIIQEDLGQEGRVGAG
ncbi:substrate-binding domain-containing protein [Cohnella sp. AR92]|uniref:substrate-binding domain-containing protein n=1 Tax=Cohnella sp. AR92 TaxID=648716 RepID=UPI001EDD3902|nr:substrate-binding domain-containing protein [Cohnella sp. AR92]